MRLALVLVALMVLVAGCTLGADENQTPAGTLPQECSATDCSWEWWNVSIAAGSNAFRIGVPLRVSPMGTSVEDWVANLTVVGDATVEANETERGVVLLVNGTGNVELRSASFRGPQKEGGKADGYLHGRWTTGQMADGLVVLVEEGQAIVSVAYRGVSSECGGGESFEGSVQGPGWGALQVQTLDITCR